MNSPTEPRARAHVYVDTLTDAELRAYLAALPSSPANYYLAARLLAGLGLRIGEAHAIDWRNITALDGPAPRLEILASQTKTGYARTLPIPPDLAHLLRTRRQTVTACAAARFAEFDQPTIDSLIDGTRILARDDGSTWTIRATQLTLLRVARATLQRPVRPHALRHTFATRLLRATNIRLVQLALGHRSLRSTQIYTHPSGEELRDAVQKIELPSATPELPKPDEPSQTPL